MRHGMFGWGLLGAILGLIILLLVIAVLGAVLAYLIRALRRPSPNETPGASGVGAPGSAAQALQVLDERYARGEIDHEDYEQRRRVLLQR